MKYTLLDLTQQILSSMNSDEVNSISDTAESMQVANIIKQTYYNMLARFDLPEHNQLFNLVGPDDETMPVLMFRPPGVSRIQWITYNNTNPADGTQFTEQFGAYSQHDVNTDLQNNAGGWFTNSTTTRTLNTGTATFTVAAGQTIPSSTTAYAIVNAQNYMYGTVISYSGTTLTLNITHVVGTGTYSSWTLSQSFSIAAGPGYQPVQMLSNREFLEMTNNFNVTESNVQSFVLTVDSSYTGLPGKFTINYRNDKTPQYCTIIGNFYIIFDSFDNSQDSTLQSAKTECFGWVLPSWQMTDGFIPNLDDQQFGILLNDSKALAFLELKNMSHAKAEQEVMRQLSSLQKFKMVANKPTWFDMLPNFGRGCSGWTGHGDDIDY